MTDAERLVYAGGIFRGAVENGSSVEKDGYRYILIDFKIAQKIIDILDRQENVERS